MAKRADPRYLRDVAYADPSAFMSRVGLYDHQQPWIDILGEALDALGPVERRVVGDVGCGNGRYVAALRVAGARVVGVDLSRGMLAKVPGAPVGLAVADAQAVPLTRAPRAAPRPVRRRDRRPH